MQTTADLDALIAAETAAPVLNDNALVKQNPKDTTVKNATIAAPTVQPIVPTTPTNVQNGVALPATPINIPGVALAFSGGDYPVELLKKMATYKGKNPFYALCDFMATAKKSCYVTITADKSQASKVKSALHSLQDREISGASKLVVRSTTEKGVCVLIRRP